MSWSILLIAASGLVADANPTASTDTPVADQVQVSEETQSPRPDVDQVVTGFIEYLTKSESYDPAARKFVLERGASLSDADKRDYINTSLAVLSDGFKIGLDLLDKEDPAKAADVFEALSIDDDPYLAVGAAIQAATALVDLEEIERCREILTGVKDAHGDIEQYTMEPDHFTFMLGYCQVHALEYEAAGQSLKTFLKRYPDAPERLRITAVQIVTELDRRLPGQLGDVRDLMNFARRRLDRGPVNEVVLARQKEAVELLDGMIKEAEDRENQNKGKGCKKCGESKCKGCQGAPKGNQNPGSGAQQSSLPGGESNTGELRRVTAKPGEEWGRMPPRQREEILQTLQRRFPSQYRELLEQYYRQLAKDAAPK